MTSGTDLATCLGLLGAILRRWPVILTGQMGKVRSAAVARYQAFRATYVDDLAQRYTPFSKLKLHFYADTDL